MAKSANTPAVQDSVKAATKRSNARKAEQIAVEILHEQEIEFVKTDEQTPEQVQEKPEKKFRKVIACKQSFGRYFIYFRHVAPKDNVGCGCKTAASAMRYCRLLMSKHDAYLPDEVYQFLKAEQAKEA